jgi:hypothetical protein
MNSTGNAARTAQRAAAERRGENAGKRGGGNMKLEGADAGPAKRLANAEA